MTRQDVMKIFPTATEDQITAFLNANGSEVNAEKEKNKELKDASKELEEAQKELEALRAKADSGAPDDWQAQIDKLTEANTNAQKTIKNMQLKNDLKDKGFSNDDADKFIKTMEEGGDIAAVMGELKKSVIATYDKERMKNTGDPDGSDGQNPDGKDKADEALAKEIAGSIGHSSKTSNDIVNAYL